MGWIVNARDWWVHDTAIRVDRVLMRMMMIVLYCIVLYCIDERVCVRCVVCVCVCVMRV